MKKAKVLIVPIDQADFQTTEFIKERLHRLFPNHEVAVIAGGRGSVVEIER